MGMSIKDIAKKTGLSVSTISRVVNNKPGISEETRELVKLAIKKYHYVPNMVARNLINRKTNTIGVIIPDMSEMYFSRIVKGIDSMLSVNDYTMILCDSNESAEKEHKLLGVLHEKQVDGIILATVQTDQQLEKETLLSSVPVCFIDNTPSLFRNYNSVSLDNAMASYLAIEHLYQLGHRKIAAIFGKQSESTGLERYQGFCKAIQDFNLVSEKDLVRFGDFKEQSGYDAVIDILKSGKEFTALYVASSKMTYGAIHALKQNGIRIPEDVSLIGFDIRDDNKLYSPTITTILQPEQNMGEMAAKLLIGSIENSLDTMFSQKTTVKPILLSCESTRPIEK